MDEELPDWTGREDHIENRSERKGWENEPNILMPWTIEAWTDPAGVLIDPDYASKSGLGMRVIGWSESAGFLVSVLAYREDGQLKGSTAFRSSKRDVKYYENDEGPQEADS
jgi:hypothetical protein